MMKKLEKGIEFRTRKITINKGVYLDILGNQYEVTGFAKLTNKWIDIVIYKTINRKNDKDNNIFFASYYTDFIKDFI